MLPPSSHTTVRTVPYTAVSVFVYLCSLCLQSLTAQLPIVDSVHYLQLRPSCEVSGQTIRISNWLPRQIQPFIVFRQLLWLLLTSDYSSCRLATAIALRQIARPPRVIHVSFSLMPVASTSMLSV